jgi:predicted AAA+ superfamily ATPase
MAKVPVLTGHVNRRALAIASLRLNDEPVVALQGARTVGKSTLLQQLASTLGASVLDLDDLALRDAAAADPGTFVKGPSPVCIDEYQHVPAILGAIKAELNRDLRPGRYLLTGSTRYDAIPTASQTLTGRLHLMSILPLSQGEIAGVEENLLEVLLADPQSAIDSSLSSTTRPDYVRRISVGGFPIALTRSTDASRNRWFDDYVELLLQRDVRELARIRRREQLPSLLRRLAGQTAQVLNLTSVANDLGMDRTTVTEYVGLLEAVFMVFRLEAWGKTLRARAAGTPKLHVVDSGVATRLLRLTPTKLVRLDPTSLTEFGHLLETFVVGELLKQVSWLDGIAGCGHWRTHDGDEVDLVVERDDGGVVAFEVKAASRVSADDMRSLRKLRDAVGDAFIAGVALYTGTRSYSSGDGLFVFPVDRIWKPI